MNPHPFLRTTPCAPNPVWSQQSNDCFLHGLWELMAISDRIAVNWVKQAGAAVVSPHAPKACGHGPLLGSQWFHLTLRDHRPIKYVCGMFFVWLAPSGHALDLPIPWYAERPFRLGLTYKTWFWWLHSVFYAMHCNRSAPHKNPSWRALLPTSSIWPGPKHLSGGN